MIEARQLAIKIIAVKLGAAFRRKLAQLRLRKEHHSAALLLQRFLKGFKARSSVYEQLLKARLHKSLSHFAALRQHQRESAQVCLAYHVRKFIRARRASDLAICRSTSTCVNSDLNRKHKNGKNRSGNVDSSFRFDQRSLQEKQINELGGTQRHLNDLKTWIYSITKPDNEPT